MRLERPTRGSSVSSWRRSANTSRTWWREPVFPQLADGGGSVPRLRPAVRTPVVRTAFSAFKGPFLLCVPTPRTTWIQGFSRAASKINVDAELFARMPETPGLLL